MKDLWKSLTGRKTRTPEPEVPSDAEAVESGPEPAASPHEGAAAQLAAEGAGAASDGPGWLSLPPPAGVGAELVSWLLQRPVLPGAALLGEERARLERLDAAIRSEHARKVLLPRAPQVVPQLLAAMRTDNVSAASLAERIERDAVLHAEVLRRANSASLGVRSEVTMLLQAINVLGTSELRALIAHHALRPIFDAPAGSLAAAMAPRIALLGERKSQIGGVIASEEGIDAFDGYLCGLVHDIGWSAIARVLDREVEELSAREQERARAAPISATFAHELLRRRDALFGLVVRPWGLTAGVTGLATIMAERATTRSPPGRSGASADAGGGPLEAVLRWAEVLAALPMMKTAQPPLPKLSPAVRDAMRRAPMPAA